MNRIIHDNTWNWGRTITVVADGGRGIVSVSVSNDDSTTAWIHGISVIEPARHKGLGNMLLAFACEMAYYHMKSTTDVMLKAAPHSFQEEWYRRNGFRKVGKDEDGLVILKRRIQR